MELEQVPEGEDLYLTGTSICVKTGKATGKKMLLDSIKDNKIIIGNGFACDTIESVFPLLEPGDEIFLDNSDYIAMQTYHRHKVPAPEFTVYDQYRDEQKRPIYPQREKSLFKNVESGQSGKIQGKIIVVESLWDESALPWQADWYRQRVAAVNEQNEKEIMRLWYMDHCSHGDLNETMSDMYLVPYIGAVRQALLDISDWVERGIKPLGTTNYQMDDGQVVIPETAVQRLGIQPVVDLFVNGEKCVHIKAGETVLFTANIETPPQSGIVTNVEWNFEEKGDFLKKGKIESVEDGRKAVASVKQRYETPGTYFAVVRVSAQRGNDIEDCYTQIKNLDRVRIVVQ